MASWDSAAQNTVSAMPELEGDLEACPPFPSSLASRSGWLCLPCLLGTQKQQVGVRGLQGHLLVSVQPEKQCDLFCFPCQLFSHTQGTSSLWPS